ncbi:hypothetical protein [Williamwhitmania taraxaci]|uniref:Uncharacterized protein n=1 Tax=Williamwhitmania taraxaci TaxID=1640674 RepID=A0A1G6LVK2_9BACT|nr:hypothetical protein [Williamwhitmania taraxaci]SDC47260.1 hypothetical protein SAMN05216323_10334 [Williamwhitmania taraxaci]
MKVLYLTVFLVLLGYLGYSQTRPPQNVHSQRIQSIYEIVDGVTTGKSYLEKQFLLDSLGRCHTEIDYDTTMTILGFKWNTYTGDNLVVRQTYLKDELVKTDSFSYELGRQIKLHFLTFKAPRGLETVIERFTYLNLAQVGQIDAKFKNGKGAYQIRYTYDSKGTEILRKVKVKKGLPADSIILLKRIPTYDSVGRIISEEVEKTIFGQPSSFEKVTSSYDKSGKLIGVISLDRADNKTSRFEYLYRDNNTLWIEKAFNSAGTLIKMEAWRTEVVGKGSSGRVTTPSD